MCVHYGFHFGLSNQRIEITKNKQGISVRVLRPSAFPESLHIRIAKHANRQEENYKKLCSRQSANLNIDISMTSKVRRILESILTRQKGFPHNGHTAIKHFY